MTDFATAMDIAINGNLVVDLENGRQFRLTQIPMSKQGESVNLTIHGKMGKFRSGKDVDLSVPKDSWLGPIAGVYYILPHDPTSIGYTLFKQNFKLELIMLKRQNAQMEKRLYDIYMASSKAETADEVRALIFDEMENRAQIAKSQRDYSNQNFFPSSRFRGGMGGSMGGGLGGIQS